LTKSSCRWVQFVCTRLFCKTKFHSTIRKDNYNINGILEKVYGSKTFSLIIKQAFLIFLSEASRMQEGTITAPIFITHSKKIL
jgi:hypothetical protein